MSLEDIILSFVIIPALSILALCIIFFHNVQWADKLITIIVNAAFSVVYMFRRVSTFEQYKRKMAREAKRELNYAYIRILEYNTNDGMVFHRLDGECELNSFKPYPSKSRILAELKMERDVTSPRRRVYLYDH